MAKAEKGLPHLDSAGAAHMVEVGHKPVTTRRAVAEGFVVLKPETAALLRAGELAKGDALAVARIAGIAAAKRTPDLIPLCHPIAITGVEVSVDLVEPTDAVQQTDSVQEIDSGQAGVAISAEVRTADRTGIEMEALTCVSTAALNIIDMVKAVDRGAYIRDIRIAHKSGGASGTWPRDAAE